MKKLCFLLAIVMLLPCFLMTACNKKEQPEGTSPQGSTPEAYSEITSEEIKNYSLILADGAGMSVMGLYWQLYSLINDQYDMQIPTDTDHSRGDNGDVGKFEILIGNTNREESKSFLSGLRWDDYGYAIVGDKLVIAGHYDETTVLAAKHFIAQFQNEDRSKVFFSSKGQYIYHHEYVASSVSLNGMDLTNASIVLNTRGVAEKFAKALQQHFTALCGVHPAILTDKEVSAQHPLIIVGESVHVPPALQSVWDATLNAGEDSGYYVGNAENAIWFNTTQEIGYYTLMREIMPKIIGQGEISVSLNNGFVSIPKAVTDQPFIYDGSFDVFTYRIPCLLTLNDGDVMAVTDLRVNILDSPNNIEIGVRVLDSKTGEWGEPIVAHQFNDYDQQYGTNTYNPVKDSASFIDAAITQTADGRIFMLVDAMPANAGGGIGGKEFNGTVKIGDTFYYALTMGDNTLATGYDYYMYPNPTPNGEHDKYIVKRVSDSTDTAYTLDAHFNVYRDGVALTVKQKPRNEIDVPMNIFYSASVLKLHRTSYFYLSYSDDKGKTWSDPMLIGSEYRKVGEIVYNKAPGVGLVIKNGEYAGRILFPLYRGDWNSQNVACLYSDDGGKTWQMSENISNGTFNNATEAQLVELPDGTLRIYSRGQGDYILFADSTDGGVTFTEMREDRSLPYCRDCMVSVLALPWKIDGRDAIAISYPEGNKPGGKRTNGVIKIGLLTQIEKGYEVEWKYSYSIGGSYAYSCLATNGQRIAVLYERDMAVHTNELVYLELPLEAFGIIDVD